MTDLYAELGLAGPSSPFVIERALQRMPPDWPLRETVTFVLMNARRRATYDRDWIAQCMIGAIRREMRLDSTTLWATSPRMPIANTEVEPRARSASVRGD